MIPCPHCNATKGTWFDRSVVMDGSGKELEYETYPDRCVECGKNVDAPRSYYGEGT